MYKNADIAVLGAGGMLGKAVVEEAKQRGYLVSPFYRSQCDITDPVSVAWSLREMSSVDWIINCTGVRHESGRSERDMVAVNALGPHNLAHFTSYLKGAKVLHVSTDCVFSGAGTVFRNGTHTRPDPIDVYGRSKLAGEVAAPHVWNIRTSFVGPDHGLWKWFGTELEHGTPEVPGWIRAFWSGSTVWAVAAGLIDFTEQTELPDEHLIHLATKAAISKYDALLDLRAYLKAADSIHIKPVDMPRINRGMMPTPGFVLPSLADALKDKQMQEERNLFKTTSKKVEH